MDNLMTGKVAEKAMDSQVGKDTWCPDLGIKVRVICFLGCYIFGKSVKAGIASLLIDLSVSRFVYGFHWVHGA